MGNNVKRFTSIFTMMMLAACGGRVANLTSATNPWDNELSCSHLHGEYKNHDKRLVELTGERGEKGLSNAGMLLVSPLFLDLSQTEKQEAQAIAARQETLDTLMQGKSCPQYTEIQAARDLADSKNASGPVNSQP